jgi:hypothetical protein
MKMRRTWRIAARQVAVGDLADSSPSRLRQLSCFLAEQNPTNIGPDLSKPRWSKRPWQLPSSAMEAIY